MKSVLGLLMVLVSVDAIAQARDIRCQCRQYEGMVHTLSLADTVAAIGVAGLESRQTLGRDDWAGVRSIADLRDTIEHMVPRECVNYILRYVRSRRYTVRAIRAPVVVPRPEAVAYQAMQRAQTLMLAVTNLRYIYMGGEACMNPFEALQAGMPDAGVSYNRGQQRFAETGVPSSGGIAEPGSPLVSAETPQQMRAAWQAYYDCGNATTADLDRSWRETLRNQPASAIRARLQELARIRRGWVESGGTLREDDIIAERLATLSVRDIELLKMYSNLVTSSRSERALLNGARELRTQLSVEERALMVSMLGGEFGGNYDPERYGLARPQSRGAVTLDQLLRARAHNSQTVARYSLYDMENPYQQFAGVCRDIASAQAQLATAFGFQNTYVTLGGTSSSPHATVIAQDPENPNRAYRWNYAETNRVDETALAGAATMHSGATDVTPAAYQMYRSGSGGFVTSLDSVMGSTLREMAGLSPLDPMSRQTSGMITHSERDAARGTEIRAAASADQMGATYVGVSLSQHYGQDTNAPGRVGLMIASSQRAPGTHGLQERGMSVDMLYGFIEQRIDSPTIQLGADVRARIETLASAIFVAHASREALPGDLGASVYWDVRAQAGLRIDQGNPWRDAFSSTFRALVQAEPALGDVRDVGSVEPAFRHALFTAEGRALLSQSAAGRAYLIAATTVVLDQLGVRGRAQLGAAFESVAVRAEVEGEIQGFQPGGIPLYIPGAPRKAGVGVSVMPHDQVRIDLLGQMTIDERLASDPSLTVQATVILDPPPPQQLPDAATVAGEEELENRATYEAALERSRRRLRAPSRQR